MPGKNPFVFSDRNLLTSRPNEKLQHAGTLGLPADFYKAPLLLQLCIFRSRPLAATLNYRLLLVPGVVDLLDHVGGLAFPERGPAVRPAKEDD